MTTGHRRAAALALCDPAVRSTWPWRISRSAAMPFVPRYAWRMTEDADFRMEADSLRLVTAGYRLNAQTLASGLDVSSGDIPNCADSGIGSRRTLLAPVKDGLVPVLQVIPTSRWGYIRKPASRCHWTGRPVRGTRDDGKPCPSAPLALQLPFDGTAYDNNRMRDTLERWSRLPAAALR